MADAPEPWKLSPESRNVFGGLMLGMFSAAIAQTIVGPAMPRIVAELGGMDHYSWVATTALLVSAITTPIVGKLSDLYGRKLFYTGGLVVFMVGAVVSGLAPSFGLLIVGRAIMGMGMGTIMPLSQTIIGDIIPPRQRGKYSGFMGAVFGVATVGGPLAGGAITDAWGWRWLFFVSLPIGLVTLLLTVRFMRIPFERRKARVDVAGMITLAGALVAILLATSWGGTVHPWASAQVLGLYAAGAVLTALFIWIQLRAEEPVLPLRLFTNSTFTLSNIAAFFLAMLMFGAMIYVPIFAQGVLGVDATTSGVLLMPLNVAQILTGIVVGLVITRTGRYKEYMLVGVLVLGIAQFLLTRLTWQSDVRALAGIMLLFGIGLGTLLQQYTLLVQNAVSRKDLGVATASTQFFRSVGSTIGISLFGTVMTGGLTESIRSHLPSGSVGAETQVDAGSVLDPAVLASLSPEVEIAVRQGLGDQLQAVFLLGLPFVIAIALATAMIRAIPLRETVHTADEARREYLDTMAQSAAEPEVLVASLSEGRAPRTRERLLGIQFSLLVNEAQRPDRPLLRRAVAEVGDGDLARGLRLLGHTAEMLLTENPTEAAEVEKYAVEVAELAARRGGLFSPDLRAALAVAAARVQPEEVLAGPEPTVAERHAAVDVDRLRVAGSDLASAFLLDVSEAGRR